MAPKQGAQATHNQKTLRKLLEANGWICGKGTKHNIKMEKDGERPITLPRHHGRDYDKSLTAAILRQAGLKGNAGKNGKAD